MSAIRNFIRLQAGRIKEKVFRKKGRNRKPWLDGKSEDEVPRSGSGKSFKVEQPRVSIREINDSIPKADRDTSLLFSLECRICSSFLPFDKTEEHVAKSFQGSCKCRMCKKCTMKHLRYNGNPDELIAQDCCEEGRLFDLWVTLGDFDREEMNRSGSAEMISTPQAIPQENESNSSSGVGFGGNSDPLAVPKYKKVDHTMYDYSLEAIIRTVTYSLPCASTTDNSQTSIMALKLLQTSLFLDKISSLARNDSIVDIGNRHHLYKAVFGFIQGLTGDPVLYKLLTEKRPDTTTSVGVLTLSDMLKNPDYSFNAGHITSPSLIECCANTYKQAKAFLVVAERQDNEDEWSDRHVKASCENIVMVYDFITNLEQEKLCTSSDVTYSSDTLWKTFMQDNKVTFTDKVLETHRYKENFTKENTSAVRNRLGTIGKEIANMTTSLPDGVFLKVGESRSDVMKVLIVGVEGTPYAGGLFTFDLYLDKSYPVTPPRMSFVLENINDDGNGTTINPNLHYGSGTVCLSILNTWRGSRDQQWQPHKSTILSVLISIQAMILGAPHPWRNEPGHETDDSDHPTVIEYSHAVQSKVVRYAMIPWLVKLETDAGKKDIWADVSASYWKYNGKAVVELVREWTKDNPALNTKFKNQGEPFSTLEKLVARCEQPLLNET